MADIDNGNYGDIDDDNDGGDDDDNDDDSRIFEV